LTLYPDMIDNSPQSILAQMGVAIMRGTIRCSKCHSNMEKAVCGKCGHTICYIVVYWRGKHHRFFKSRDDGEPFTFGRAGKQLVEINLELNRKDFNPKRWTVEAVKSRAFQRQIDKWLERKTHEKDVGEFAPSTLKSYRNYARNHFPFFGGKAIADIEYADLEDFKDHLADKGIKIKSRKNILNGLHAFFTWAFKRGILKVIPPFPTVEGDDAEPRTALTLAEQMEALERLPEAHRDVISFAMETGLRPGELCALKAADVDLSGGSLLVQRTYSASELKQTTKGKNKKRIPLSDTALDLARRHLRDKLPEAWLFINPDTGRGYRVEYIRRVWRLHSGVQATLYEATRHSFCTQIVEDGADTRQAQELMRHLDRRSTEAYIHAGIERHRNLVNQRGKGKVLPIQLKQKSAEAAIDTKAVPQKSAKPPIERVLNESQGS
jgi:integrase